MVSTQQPLLEQGRESEWLSAVADWKPSLKVRSLANGDWQRDLVSHDFVAVFVRAHPQTHEKTKESSPPSWFIDRMRSLRESRPNLKFFLSCDTRSAELLICNAVDGVIVQPKTGRYNSKLGVQEAVADLYVASRAAAIVGPYWSSFADLAMALSERVGAIETPRSSYKVDDVLCNDRVEREL